MCNNPLDMSNSKYTKRVPSAQRDMNPLGNHLKKGSPFMRKNLRAKDAGRGAEDPLVGKKSAGEATSEVQDHMNKYQK